MKVSGRTGPFWDIMEGRSPQPPVAKYLGYKILALDADRGSATLEQTARPEFCNGLGTVHGGIITAMLDDAMSIAAVAFLDGKRVTPTIELKVTFVRPATLGRLLVEASVIHGGQNIMFLAGAVRDTEGQLLAAASATYRVVDWPTPKKPGK
jgi:uncharacterized protein (TIGR00369 family)